jgi:hypothetical protein
MSPRTLAAIQFLRSVFSLPFNFRIVVDLRGSRQSAGCSCVVSKSLIGRQSTYQPPSDGRDYAADNAVHTCTNAPGISSIPALYLNLIH